jgi:hypothetical protein
MEREMTTVVAVFAYLAPAQDAMGRLEALGMPRSRMSLHEQADRDRLRTGAAQVQGGVPDDSGGFLGWLLGSGDDRSARRDGPVDAGGPTRTDYAEVFGRGHVVLGVGAATATATAAAQDPPTVAAVTEILRECGAIVVEERAARHWETTGAAD